jgi:hypothetical protein
MIQLYIKTSKFQRGLLPGIAVQEEDDSTSSECFGTTEAEDKPWLKLQKSGASFSRKCKSVQSIPAVHQLNFIPYPSQTSQIQGPASRSKADFQKSERLISAGCGKESAAIGAGNPATSGPRPGLEEQGRMR